MGFKFNPVTGNFDTSTNTTFSTSTISGDLTVTGGDITIQGTNAKLHLTDTDHDDDFLVFNDNGTFKIYDATNSAERIAIASNGQATLKNDTTVDGKLGVGTASPNGKLTVYRSTEFAGNPVFEARSNHGGTNSLKFSVDGDGDAAFTNNVELGGNIRSDEILLQNTAGSENYLEADAATNSAVSLFHNNIKRISTTSTGALITSPSGSAPTLELRNGSISIHNEVIRFARTDNTPIRYHSIYAAQGVTSSTTANNFLEFRIHNDDVGLTAQNTQLRMTNEEVSLRYDGTEKLVTTSGGITVTGSVTTQDMNMSNLNGFANEVDNTKGSWSIQEGSDDLFLINRVNGKKYKFNLTEIN